MSKALGRKLVKERGIKSADLMSPVYCKYLKTSGLFKFKVPMYGEEEGKNESGVLPYLPIYISERVLRTLMNYEGVNRLVDKEIGEEYAFDKSVDEMMREELGLIESSGGLLCMDELEVLSIAMCCNRVNEVEMLRVKRAEHLKRLGKLKSSVVELTPFSSSDIFVLCGEGKSARGRRVGSGNKISEEDWVVMVYNFSHYEEIVENCLKHDWFDEFYMLEKDCAKVSGANGGKMDRKKVVEKWRELKKDRGKTGAK